MKAITIIAALLLCSTAQAGPLDHIVDRVSEFRPIQRIGEWRPLERLGERLSERPKLRQVRQRIGAMRVLPRNR